jgi:hypothetical protein
MKRRLPAFLAAACLMAGCQTPHPFATPTAQWRTEIGQLQFANAKRSFIGEVVVSSDRDREFQLDFSAGPGIPIMKLRQSGGIARVEAIFARTTWQGGTAHIPSPLKSWLGLREVFAQLSSGHPKTGRVALHSAQPGFWKAAATLAGGAPRDITVEFPRSGERFVFHFSR